jgi:hypothetical protein
MKHIEDGKKKVEKRVEIVLLNPMKMCRTKTYLIRSINKKIPLKILIKGMVRLKKSLTQNQ